MKIKVLTKEETEKRKSEHARVISDLTKKKLPQKEVNPF